MHIDGVVDLLRAAGCVFAEEEAGLLAEAAGTDVGVLDELVARRVAGEPLEHLLGWVAFAGLRVPVGPGVFVPRRRSELLVTEALALRPGADAVVVELCCGAAAVAAAVLARLPGAQVHAADVDPVAAGYARRTLAGRGAVHVGDLFAALPPALAGRVDLLLVNAPYVPTDAIATMPPEARLHEPRVALDGGADGLDLHRRVAAGAPGWLAPGGALLIETSRSQAERTAALCAAAGLIPRVARDDDLDATAVAALRPPSSR